MPELAVTRASSYGRRAALTLTLGVIALGCRASVADANGREGLNDPSRTNFPNVANAMQMSCGTLDCHGQLGRDLRLYGFRGLRLDPNDTPLERFSTDAEYDASFRSVVGLEPETMSRVVADKGAHPERLTMIRKARGLEQHKGGPRMVEGDDLDRCLVTWLAGDYDDAACSAVANSPRPEKD
jgi:hypothetical protein